MRFYAGNLSNGNQTEELHTTHILDWIAYRQSQQWKSSKGAAQDLHTGWNFLQILSAIENKQRH